jgi:hypothetical protein
MAFVAGHEAARERVPVTGAGYSTLNRRNRQSFSRRSVRAISSIPPQPRRIVHVPPMTTVVTWHELWHYQILSASLAAILPTPREGGNCTNLSPERMGPPRGFL